MAHFRGTIQGARGEASRLGHKTSGLTTTNNGWHQGVKVRAWVDGEGHDIHDIIITGGSDRGMQSTLIGRVIDGQYCPAA